MDTLSLGLPHIFIFLANVNILQTTTSTVGKHVWMMSFKLSKFYSIVNHMNFCTFLQTVAFASFCFVVFKCVQTAGNSQYS